MPLAFSMTYWKVGGNTRLSLLGRKETQKDTAENLVEVQRFVDFVLQATRKKVNK